ncbi:hypothetical protein QFC20_006679 [Naganishia adeliensis]|uniref:Uncharacterized protein n=1 Tax=Naganishia adeliensis TaxID=92952 RepID=A0ACC2V8U1_9TREE|nr:hypothetical protein QFC20_006679 [Naganishia adeliensis]
MDAHADAVKNVYQSTPYQAAGAALMRHDPSRSVIAHHYCTHLHGKNMHQCLIFDSDTPGARLIGIEYVVPEETFQALDDEEKKYWHSHKFAAVADTAEIPAMTELQTTYGKTIHTWQYDIHPDFPLGPPQLMMAYTADSQIDQGLLAARDAEAGTNTAAKKEYRKTYLPTEGIEKMPLPGADGWLSGKTVQFEPVEKEVVPKPDAGRSRVDGSVEKA